METFAPSNKFQAQFQMNDWNLLSRSF